MGSVVTVQNVKCRNNQKKNVVLCGTSFFLVLMVSVCTELMTQDPELGQLSDVQ